MLKQTIVTKFLGPTNTRGARIKATASKARPSLTLDWDHALSAEGNYRKAAAALAAKLKWTGPLQAGVLPDNSVVHVFLD